MALMVGISAGLKCYQCDPDDHPCPDAVKLNATHVVTCTDGEDSCMKSMYCIILKLTRTVAAFGGCARPPADGSLRWPTPTPAARNTCPYHCKKNILE